MRVEKIGDATLYMGDCMEVMSGLAENEFNLCVADPWYGIGMTKNDTTGFAKRRFRLIENNIGKEELQSFNDEAPPKEHFDEIRRVSKNQIIWGGNYFLDYLGNCRAPIIWDKGTGANYFADGEFAWTSFQRGCLRIVKHQWCGAFKDSERDEKIIHPCQKPVFVYRWLYDRFSEAGQKIFDPYLGSGSSVIATIGRGLKITACEIQEKYFDNACRRIEFAYKQPRLFEEPKTKKEVEPSLF